MLLRDGAARAGQVVPYTTQAPIGSTDPLELYKWLANYEAKTGGSALAIAHNGNLSNGLMFPVDKQFNGRKIDRNYVEQRARWEVMYEFTQIKGDGDEVPVRGLGEIEDVEAEDVITSYSIHYTKLYESG